MLKPTILGGKTIRSNRKQRTKTKKILGCNSFRLMDMHFHIVLWVPVKNIMTRTKTKFRIDNDIFLSHYLLMTSYDFVFVVAHCDFIHFATKWERDYLWFESPKGIIYLNLNYHFEWTFQAPRTCQS